MHVHCMAVLLSDVLLFLSWNFVYFYSAGLGVSPTSLLSIAGFVSAISEAAPDLRFTLLTLHVSSAYGAAALGAEEEEFILTLDYASHTSVLYCHEL